MLLWLSRISQSHDDAQTIKILNLSPKAALPPSRIDLYFKARNLFLQKLGVNARTDNIMTEVNIIPARSKVPVHHDEDLVISTARSLASHARPDVKRSIAKIWIVWPPGHTHSFSLRGSRISYGDTTYSLHNAEGAVWFAQRDGETVVLPKDLAHTTFTLQSCCLLTSICPGVSLARVPLISSDIDIGLVMECDELENGAMRLEHIARDTMQWGSGNKVEFEVSKTEVLLFCRRKKVLRAATTVVVNIGEQSFAIKQDATKWLGFGLDSKLSFKTHFENRLASAKGSLQRVASLSGSNGGLSINLMRRVVVAAVTSVALYSSEVWWRGQQD